jgi:hypothetical protein
VRVTSRDGRSYVELAGLDRSTVAEGLDDEIRSLAMAVVPTATLDTGESGGSVTEVEAR